VTPYFLVLTYFNFSEGLFHNKTYIFGIIRFLAKVTMWRDNIILYQHFDNNGNPLQRLKILK